MSVIDDSRTLLQDIVTPDLKAIAARLDAIEVLVMTRFDAIDKATHDRFEANESLNKQRFDSVDQRFTAAEKLAEVRHNVLLTAIQTGNAASDAKIDSLPRI